MPINTLYQLMSLVDSDAPQLQIAATLLTIPDLLNYWLTGATVCEFTNATTTQLFNPTSGTWAHALIDRLGLPGQIFPEVVQPGTRLGVFGKLPVIAPACHDTGNAVAAIPAQSAGAAYISSGTWSLVGLEVPEPIMTPAALEANVTNEGGVEGTYRLLKNVMGLWIVQQCRATWASEGHSYSYAELVELAHAAPALQTFFDLNDPRFLPAGDHPALIAAWCAEHGLPAPESHAAIIRCVLESLALAYRRVLRTLDALAGRVSDTVHVVGGGARNALLCQMTADATGVPVLAGPVEATVIGNALVQLIALGELKDIREARALVARMDDLRRYEPRDTAAWEAADARFAQAVASRA
jgi:rhamnulokinase